MTRDLRLKLGAVILTGDFHKAVERETPSGDFGERRTLRSEANPMVKNGQVDWGGGEEGGEGVMVLPQSQSQ